MSTPTSSLTNDERFLAINALSHMLGSQVIKDPSFLAKHITLHQRLCKEHREHLEVTNPLGKITKPNKE